MKLKDFTVGQTAYMFGDDSRRNKLNNVAEVEVVKVGRKYVTVSRKDYRWEERFFSRWDESPYLVEDVDYGYPRLLFPSKAAADEYAETQELRTYICGAIDMLKIKQYSLKQLRAIKKIIDES